MAYIGQCAHHGQYCNVCLGCQAELPARLVVEEIKKGTDPDVALEKVLTKLRKDQLAQEQKANKDRLEENLKELARNRWLTDNLPNHLKSNGPFYG